MFEAVMNAFQAIEEAIEKFGGDGSGHEIAIIAQRQGDITDAEKPSGPFEAFTIIDTGIGFTGDNFKSFDTVYLTYKLSRGGKGLGRFLWLKAFNRVEIKSHYCEKGFYRSRSFEFRSDLEDLDVATVPSERKTPLTTVQLIGFRSPYRDECPRSLETIAQHLVAHFLPMFLEPTGPALLLSEEGGSSVDLRRFFQEHLQTFASKRRFIVSDQEFSLSGFRFTEESQSITS